MNVNALNYLYTSKGKPRSRTLLAHEIFDYLVDNITGTYLDFQRAFDKERGQVRQGIRALRLILGEGDSINVACEPTKARQQWVYRLVGNVDDARWYVANRFSFIEAHLATLFAIAKSLEEATDGRTVDGKKARAIRSSLGYLIEQLDMMPQP